MSHIRIRRRNFHIFTSYSSRCNKSNSHLTWATIERRHYKSWWFFPIKTSSLDSEVCFHSSSRQKELLGGSPLERISAQVTKARNLRRMIFSLPLKKDTKSGDQPEWSVYMIFVLWVQSFSNFFMENGTCQLKLWNLPSFSGFVNQFWVHQSNTGTAKPHIWGIGRMFKYLKGFHPLDRVNEKKNCFASMSLGVSESKDEVSTMQWWYDLFANPSTILRPLWICSFCSKDPKCSSLVRLLILGKNKNGKLATWDIASMPRWNTFSPMLQWSLMMGTCVFSIQLYFCWRFC